MALTLGSTRVVLSFVCEVMQTYGMKMFQGQHGGVITFSSAFLIRERRNKQLQLAVQGM